MEWAQRLDEVTEVSADGAPLSFTITAGTSGGREANGDVLPAVGTPEHGGAPRRFRVGVGSTSSTYRNRAGAPGPYLPTPPPV